MNDLDDLIDRLEGARDALYALAQRDGVSQPEFHRLTGKREGVLLALSYVREMRR